MTRVEKFKRMGRTPFKVTYDVLGIGNISFEVLIDSEMAEDCSVDGLGKIAAAVQEAGRKHLAAAASKKYGSPVTFGKESENLIEMREFEQVYDTEVVVYVNGKRFMALHPNDEVLQRAETYQQELQSVYCELRGKKLISNRDIVSLQYEYKY